VHASPGRLAGIIDHAVADVDIGAAFEHLRQALVQQLNARAVGHCQHYQMHYRILRTHCAEQLVGLSVLARRPGPSSPGPGEVLKPGRWEERPTGGRIAAERRDGRGRHRCEIAETVGRHLNVPAMSIPDEQAVDHFEAFPFMTLDITMSNADTRHLLD
jgi:hypothetical protein